MSKADYNPDNSTDNEAEATKLSSTVDDDGEDYMQTSSVSCKCKGDCGTKRCACKKAGGSCQDNCKCRTEKCSNRTPELPQSTTNDADLEKNQENVRKLFIELNSVRQQFHVLQGPTFSQQ